jgi:hypothetical protein
MFTNWMTTIAGLVPIAIAVLDGVQTLAGQNYTGNWKQDIGLFAAGLVGVLAKDFNVTGGTPSNPATTT